MPEALPRQEARSVGSILLEHATLGPIRLRVDSVFGRAANLAFAEDREDGLMFSVVHPDLGSFPNALVAEGDCYPLDRCLAIGANAVLDGGHLVIGDEFAVSLSGAPVWRARHVRARLVSSGRAAGCIEAAYRILLSRPADGLACLARCRDELLTEMTPAALSSFDSRVAQLGLEALHRAILGVRAGCVDEFTDAAESIIGLGPGLTPSGDDVLAGFMGAFLETMRADSACFRKALELFARVLGVAAGRTTRVSVSFLGLASKGHVSERLNEVIVATLEGSLTEAEESMNRLLGVGATSGSDLLLGVALGIEMGLQMSCHSC